MSENPTLDREKLLVLFDGHCGMCDATVQWIIKHDHHARFQMAPLQGETARGIIQRHPELPENLDSILLVRQELGGEAVSWESSAFFSIASELSLPWRWLALGRLVPRLISDSVYRIVARHRLRFFGSLDTCRIPDAHEIERFLP